MQELFEDEINRIKLKFDTEEMLPVLNQKNINFHYDVHHKGYVDSAKKDPGDTFSLAGTFLHNMYWENLQKPDSKNKPTEKVLDFLKSKFGSWADFKKDWETNALSTKGSQWVYLSKSGKIKTIDKHQIKRDILLILDMWEHAYYPTYGPDKKSYIKNMWLSYNWEIVDQRLGGK